MYEWFCPLFRFTKLGCLTKHIVIILLVQMCRQISAERKVKQHTQPNIAYFHDVYNAIHSTEFSFRNSAKEYPCHTNNR